MTASLDRFGNVPGMVVLLLICFLFDWTLDFDFFALLDAGELSYSNHRLITDNKTSKPQVRFIWTLAHELPDSLLEELTLGTARDHRAHEQSKPSESPRSRMPSAFQQPRLFNFHDVFRAPRFPS